jgi:hypothetical protein
VLIIHGIYSWGRRRVAYRNDYCLTCDALRIAFQHRTVDVLHVFWIPVLPLGVWWRWHCALCGQDPHAHVRTRRGYKWAGAAVLLLMALSGWAVSPDEKPDDAIFIWVMRLGGLAAAGWAAWAAANSPPDRQLKDMLRAVQPILDAECPVCGDTLLPIEPAWTCRRCGLARRALPA